MSPSANSNVAETPWHGYLTVLVISGILRAGVLVALSSSLEADPDSYRQYAECLAEHGDFLRNGRPSAWRPPLYPLLLSGCLDLAVPAVVVIAALHWTLGLGTVALAMSLALRLGLGRASLLVGLLVAADPILLGESASIMTETLATVLAVMAMWAIDRLLSQPSPRAVIVAGIVTGLAILCRPTFLIWAVLLLAIVVGRTRSRWATSGVFLLAVLLTIAPWAIRNWIELGRPVMTTTHGGYTLLLGNNPYFYEFLRTRKPGATWDSREFVADWQHRLQQAKVDQEIAEDRFAYVLARENITAAPQSFLRTCGARLGSFWRIAPHPTPTTQLGQVAKAAIATWYCAVYLFALIGLASLARRRPPNYGRNWASREDQRARWLPALSLVVTFSAVHVVFWSDMRMRAPVMPSLALLAGYGAVLLWTRWNGANGREFRR